MATKADDRRRKGKTPAGVTRPSPVAMTLEARYVFDAAAGGEAMAAALPESHADAVMAKVAAAGQEATAKHDWLAKVEAPHDEASKSGV